MEVAYHASGTGIVGVQWTQENPPFKWEKFDLLCNLPQHQFSDVEQQQQQQQQLLCSKILN